MNDEPVDDYYLKRDAPAGAVFVCNFSNVFHRTCMLLEPHDASRGNPVYVKALTLDDTFDSDNVLMVSTIALIEEDVRIA